MKGEKRRGDFRRGGGGQSQKKTQREGTKKKGGEYMPGKKGTWPICHCTDVYPQSAFHQSTRVKRHDIAFLFPHCAEAWVTSYF